MGKRDRVTAKAEGRTTPRERKKAGWQHFLSNFERELHNDSEVSTKNVPVTTLGPDSKGMISTETKLIN